MKRIDRSAAVDPGFGDELDAPTCLGDEDWGSLDEPADAWFALRAPLREVPTAAPAEEIRAA